MLLKLIPLPSQPTIHFSLNLPTFPSHLEPPQSYTAQINHLLVEDLEIPNTLHSLDKSVGLMSLLEEVVFEIKDGTGDGGGGGGESEKVVHVTCRFVDGAIEEWVSDATRLIFALECIVQNVQESTVEDDRERERYHQSQMQNNRSRALNRLSMSSGPGPVLTMAGSKPRHKKQRSLFMQIVSSIVNLTSTSSSSSSHLPTFVDPSQPESFYSPPQSPTSDTASLRPPSSKRARLLRRTARSNLVNTYRRHVLPELTCLFPKEGGFGVWILHSMRRRALDRMEDLIQEATRLQQQHDQQQQVSEVRQRREHNEQQYRHEQERLRSPIRVDEQPFGSRFSIEEAGFSATTMTVPLSFSDEGGSTENENASANASNGIGNREVEDDLETITDGSSVHTPSSTSHIGTGFMEGSCTASPPGLTTLSSFSTLTTIQHPPLPSNPLLSNPQLTLPPHFNFEYTQLFRLRERLHSLILFADSQARIAEDEKRNREEILLVRGRRRAWLNAELGVGKGVWGRKDGGGAATGMGQMQWGFAAPFKSSPLARHSWSASAELDESTDDANDTSGCLPDSQQQRVDEEDDESPYDEFSGPPIVRNHTLSYVHGRQSRRSRYINGRGSGKKLLPVTEEFEYEYDQNSTHSDSNGTEEGVINVHFYNPHPDDSFHHRDDSLLHNQDGDVDSLSDNFSLEDPRELDLELGFGLQDSSSLVGEDGQESFSVGGDNQREREQRKSGESIRVAFEMERPNIIPRVRDGETGGDDDSMSTSTTSSSSSRSSGLLSWGYWGVGKNNSDWGNSDAAVRRRRSWKNGIGLVGIGLGSRGRSLNKTCQQRGSEEEEEQFLPRIRSRVSMSSTSSASSSSSTKSQQQHQHQREPAQVELEPELLQNDGQDQKTTPLLCQPVSFFVSHTPAPGVITSLPQPASVTTTITTAVVAISPPDDTTTPPNDLTTPPSDTTTPPKDTTTENSKDATPAATITSVPTPSLSFIATKKLCMASPAPNVYADLDVSVVHVGDDDKSTNLGFVGNQGANHIGTQVQAQAPQRLRPRRHKREYQYQHQHPHHQHNDVYYGQDECNEYELSGYGQFGENHHQHQHQQRHKSMIHARRHLDDLLLEEGFYGCDTMSMGGDQEEFTLAMDVPAIGSGRGGNSVGRKKLRKMQYLHLHQNRDSSQQSRLQLQQLHQEQLSSSPPNDFSTNRESPKGPVAC